VNDRQPTHPPSTSGRWRRVVRFAPVAIVACALGALVCSGALKHLSLGELRASRGLLTQGVHAHPALSILAYLGVYIAAVTLSLPAALILTLSGGFLFGPWLGGVSAAFGSTLGATAVFLISRLTVGDALERGVSPRVKALEEGIKQDAFFYLLTLRLIPVTPFWLVNVAAGLLSIRLRTYVSATLLGIFPASMIYAGIGSGLGRMFDRGAAPTLHSLITPELALPLAGLGLLSILPIVYHRLRARRAREAGRAPSVAERSGVQ
jgi:uncharacterized membrane protein YdjX (TVP38/TMEM64 family)